jgi:hypothetical protein
MAVHWSPQINSRGRGPADLMHNGGHGLPDKPSTPRGLRRVRYKQKAGADKRQKRLQQRIRAWEAACKADPHGGRGFTKPGSMKK